MVTALVLRNKGEDPMVLVLHGPVSLIKQRLNEFLRKEKV